MSHLQRQPVPSLVELTVYLCQIDLTAHRVRVTDVEVLSSSVVASTPGSQRASGREHDSAAGPRCAGIEGIGTEKIREPEPSQQRRA